tara:strand:- start:7033 stop:7758 length:726 start_codon:yes stop_codon:yes gene_type:complete
MSTTSAEISAVVILVSPKRHAEARVLQKLVEIQCREYEIPVMLSFDEGWNNGKETLVNALKMPGGKGKRRLIIHDDILIPKGTIRKLHHILPNLPAAVFVSAYCPANKGFDEAHARGHHFLLTASNVWAQALLYPEPLIDRAIKYYEEWFLRECRYDDSVLKSFLKKHKLKVHTIVPSLVQHLGAYRSGYGFAGKAGRFRHSDIFDPNFDPESVDWPRALATAYRNEINQSDIIVDPSLGG